MSTTKTNPEPKPFRVYDARSIGSAIRHFRDSAGLTQAQLAEQAGIDRTYLSRLENGLETEQLRRLLRILGKLGVRITLSRADW